MNDTVVIGDFGEKLLCGFVRVGLRGQGERRGRQQAHAGLSRSLDTKERNGALVGTSSVEETIYDDGVRRGDLQCLPAGVRGKGVGLCQVHRLFIHSNGREGQVRRQRCRGGFISCCEVRSRVRRRACQLTLENCFDRKAAVP